MRSVTVMWIGLVLLVAMGGPASAAGPSLQDAWSQLNELQTEDNHCNGLVDRNCTCQNNNNGCIKDQQCELYTAVSCVVGD